MDYLTPYAFASEQRLLAYLKREGGSPGVGDSAEARIAVIGAGNAAAGWLEAYTGRRLAARTYRTAVSLGSCTVAANGLSVSGADFTTNAKALDDLVAPSLLAPGTRIASIASATALTLSRKAEAGSAVLTAGSEGLLFDGTGETLARLPEYPVSAVYSLAYLDADGTATDIDTTGARLDGRTGFYQLTQDALPLGSLNVRVEMRAGYEEPTGATRGHAAEWGALERIFLRVAKIFFEDERLRGGRIVSESVGQVSASLPDFKMPADITEALVPFVRHW